MRKATRTAAPQAWQTSLRFVGWSAASLPGSLLFLVPVGEWYTTLAMALASFGCMVATGTAVAVIYLLAAWPNWRTLAGACGAIIVAFAWWLPWLLRHSAI